MSHVCKNDKLWANIFDEEYLGSNSDKVESRSEFEMINNVL